MKLEKKKKSKLRNPLFVPSRFYQGFFFSLFHGLKKRYFIKAHIVVNFPARPKVEACFLQDLSVVGELGTLIDPYDPKLLNIFLALYFTLDPSRIQVNSQRSMPICDRPPLLYASPFGFLLHSTLTSRRSLCDDEKTFFETIFHFGMKERVLKMRNVSGFFFSPFSLSLLTFDSLLILIAVAMAFCLPSNLEHFIPPPSEQRSQPPPWRGSFVVRGANSDRTIAQNIFVTAVETDGEKYVVVDACPYAFVSNIGK